MKLFVGLGNPGAKYAKNRHNVGFMAVERIADAHGFGPWKKKFSGLISEGEIGGARVMLLKPGTYMNESGQSAGEAARFLKIKGADIFAFYDEIDLAPGKVKVKAGGGAAGHNGVRSLAAHLEPDFKRVRIGIGHPGSKDVVVHHVLNDFAKVDYAWLDPLLDAIAKASPHLARGDDARFLSEVALLTQPEKKVKKAETEEAAEPKARTAPSRHPAGERAAKRQSALAENLKKWLSGRKSKD